MSKENNMIDMDLVKQLKSAYRKYKANIYYDNRSTIQRQKLAEFESDNFRSGNLFDYNKFDEYFVTLAKKLINFSKELFDGITNEINIFSIPKSMKEENKDENVIRNFSSSSNTVEKIHYFIDLPIEGHILGTLWILRCGFLLDDKLYNHCYGNRIRESVLKELKESYKNKNEWFESCTPFLFTPYFNNYENWRDNALDSVKQLKKLNKHAIMLSLDFKDYYYSSLIDFKNIRKDINNVKTKLREDKINESNENICEFNDKIDDSLTTFIESVFNTYSNKFIRDDDFPMIPLGFLPSLIISNWNLQGFDQAVLEDVNPYYYGRYVDDILIVFESHEKSEAHGQQLIEELSLDDFLNKYFTSNDPKPYNEILKIVSNDENGIVYGVHNLPNLPEQKDVNINYKYENLRMQRDKLKMYLFSHKCSNAMINNFQREIRKNSSEFQLMHHMEGLTTSLVENLHKIEYHESINKLKDIKNIKINKYEISKYLSRINQNLLLIPNIDEKYIDEVLFAFKENLLDYVILWEKIFTTLYLNHDYDKLLDLVKEINVLIDKLECAPSDLKSDGCKYELNQDDELKYLKNTLTNILYCSIMRVISLSLNKDANGLYGYLGINLDKGLSNLEFGLDDEKIGGNISKDFKTNIDNLIFSSMQNGSYMKYPIQDTGNVLEIIQNYSISGDFDKEYDLINGYYSKEPFKGIYPKYVKFHEIILNKVHSQIFCNSNKHIDETIDDLLEHIVDQLLVVMEENSEDSKLQEILNNALVIKMHFNINFNNSGRDLKNLLSEIGKYDELDFNDEIEKIERLLGSRVCNNMKKVYEEYNRLNFDLPEESRKQNSSNPFFNYIGFGCNNKNCTNIVNGYDVETIIVGNESKNKIKVGLVNTKINDKFFEYKLTGMNTLFEKRHEKLVKIINSAIDKSVELLLMPEMYVPYEWVPAILKIVKDQQMMMVFGVEPIENNGIIENYIMIALPFKVDDDYHECILLHRPKNEYSPKEIQDIKKFKKNPLNERKNHQYYYCIWNGIHIAPYYCYEITDIKARSLFKGCCEILTVSEFNKDVNYFDSIGESLSRDLYCYCLKSNTSDFGGSEIIQPTKTETKIPVKLKGGQEDYLVTHELDLKALREEKSKSDLVPDNNSFKPKPCAFKDCDKY